MFACLQTLLQINLLQIREKVWFLILFKPHKCKHWIKATTTFLLHSQVQGLPSTSVKIGDKEVEITAGT